MTEQDITRFSIKSLVLRNFRNYEHLKVSADQDFTIFIGKNGAGKTNILEAISLFIPGRGLRNAKLIDMLNLHTKAQKWELTAEIENQYGLVEIKTSKTNEDVKNRREVMVDQKRASVSELSKLISISWLTPQMLKLFTSAPDEHRRFLDSIANNFDKEYASTLYKYEHYVTERMAILKSGKYDPDWMKVVEDEITKAGVAIAYARVAMIDMINETMKCLDYPIPKALLSVDGYLENKAKDVPAVYLEEEFRGILAKNRDQDLEQKRTNAGIHRSNLLVYNLEKGIKADMCSTGEQKFLLISIFIAQILAQVKWKNKMPIVLLDDITEHLDAGRQRLLFDILKELKAQTWVTSANPDVKQYFDTNVSFFDVCANNVLAN